MLRNQDGRLKVPAEVPGTVFETLLKENIIKDPFYGNNEHEINKIAYEDWIYETHFEINDEIFSYNHIILNFKGLDTIANVNLNGIYLGRVNNMFRSYRFKIKDILNKNDNLLEVEFKSPIQKAAKLVDEYKVKLKTTHSIPGLPYIRKAQYSFGWDWGPELPDIGIWKDVELIAYDGLEVESYYIDMDFTYNKELNNLSSPKDYESLTIEKVDLKIIVKLSEMLKTDEINEFELKCTITGPDDISYIGFCDLTKSEFLFTFTIEYPYIWWTHDLGKPNLYEIDISLYYNNEKIDFIKEKFGIRDIQLVREPDQWGETFYFRLNGIPIFAKGANWVPIDSFLPRGKKLGIYEKNINNCLAANMNMIRVWGGGIYEDDLFYTLCDKLGLILWQDFPFACAIYPIHEEFVENVRKEAIENIKRLRNHPSLALWCGNNEIEQLWKWLLDNAELRDPILIQKYEKGYLNLFKELIPDLIKNYDPRHPYWPSSALDKYDGSKVLSIDPNNSESGDSHFWKVWHGGAPFKSYRKFPSRFMSEFGFESFPSIKTIKRFCPENELYLDSPVMTNHQKNEGGNQKILRYMKKRFTIPQEFEKQVILSQITQAEAIQYGVEFWRQNRNEFHCMGTIYWQLNDCWPVASWSSFDYYGRWKALHYLAKRFYAPLLPSVKEFQNKVEFWIINDYSFPRSVTFYWKLLNNDGKVLNNELYKVEVPPCTAQLLETVRLSEYKTDLELKQNVIFYGIEGDHLLKGFRFFNAPKKFEVKEPKISWNLEEIKKEANTKCRIKIRCENMAFYVYIDSEVYDFIASDNYFSMEPNEERTIVLNNIRLISNLPEKSDLKNSFKVSSLYDLMKNA
jgi:beta-mannosidase